MVPVARRNLFADKMRFVISLSGVGFAVLLILVVLSLYRGFASQATAFVGGVNADVWVLQSGAKDIYHSSSVLPASTGDSLRSVSGVQSVTPLYGRTLSASYQGGEGDLYLMSLDLPSQTPPLKNIKSGPLPGQIIIDSAFAAKTGLKVGDALTIEGKTLMVGSIGDIGNTVMAQFALISPQDARSLLSVDNLVNWFLVKVSDGSQPSTVARAIEANVPGVDTLTRDELVSANRKDLNESFLPVVGVLVIVAFVVGSAVVGLTIYTATVERSREYAVMKAIGASGGYLIRIVLVQSMIVGLAGFLVGVPATIGINHLATQMAPEFVNVLRWQDAAVVLVAAVGMSVLAALLPIKRVAGIEPVAVFRA